MINSTGKEPTADQIAKQLGVETGQVALAMDAVQEPVSLFEPVYSVSEDPVYVMDQISDKHNTDELWLEQICINDALKKLDSREKRILALRYYKGKTQMEVSRQIGISQAQVSRLEKAAMQRIRTETR